LAANNETEKLLSPKRRNKGAERQKEEGGISAKDVAMFGAEMIPGVGEAMAVKRTSDALDEKDYLGAGIEAAAGLMGIIPGVGDAAGRGLREVTKVLRKDAKLNIDNPGFNEIYQETYAETKQKSADAAKKRAVKGGQKDTYAVNLGNEEGVTGYANKVTFKPEELKDLPGAMGEEKFRSSGEKLKRLKKSIAKEGYKPENNTILIHVREDGQPFVVEGNTRLAEALESGRETINADIRYLRGAEEKTGPLDPKNIFPNQIKEADALEIGINPATKDGALLKKYNISTSKNIVENSSAATAGTKEANKLINAKVADGTQVGIRLNLNSTIPNMPRGLDKLQTLHQKNYNGKALSYRPFATVENVTFNVNQKGRQGIAAKIKGVDVPEAKNKFPAMSVDGQLNNNRNILDEMDDDVVEIGFNPMSGHLFVDMSTGQAVQSAEVATVIGDRVYAKGVTYMKKAEAPNPLSASDGTPLPSEVRYKMKKGGVVPMDRQMSMFDDGGLMDEGGTVDPVSGNDVPPGSTQEEVRDDIPAQLSEGEFVMPADVVRYHGLDKMMQLRQEAKMGLKIMEEMGQMGNSEEATIPDDLPFNFEDLELDDGPREMQVGGYVAPNLPMQTQQSSFANYNPQYNVPQQNQFTSYTPPVQQATPTAPTMDTLPTFEQFVPAAGEPRKYINPETGAILMIPVDGQGNLMYPPPAGFVLESEYQAPTPDTVTTPAPVQQVSQQQQTEKDSGTPEVDAYNAERQKLMKERKEAAKNLGYTKEQSTGAAILGFLTKGLVGGDEERGTIMQDGTIADGQGNYFDPLSGEQRGFLGTTNRGKGEFQVTQEMYDQGITPASLAGLRNMIGDKSIEDLIGKSVEDDTLTSPATSLAGSIDAEVNAAADPRVETTLGQTSTLSQTEQALRDANVGDVAKYFAGEKAQEILSFMDKDGALSNKQKLEYITTLADQGKGIINFPTESNILPQNVDFSQFSPEARNTAKAIVSRIESEGDDAIKNQLALTRKKITEDSITEAATASSASSQNAQAFRRAEARRADVDFMSPATARKTDARNKLDEAKKSNPKQYRTDVRSGKYDKEFDIIDRSTREENLEKNSRPNKAGVNLAEKVGTENASKIRDDQGTATNVDKGGNIYYSSDHDWSKKTQTNINSGQSSGAQEKSDTRDKIVCTAMNNAYGFGSFRQAIWLQHSKNMDPAYQRGYHYIFKPLIKVAYNDKKWYNIIVRKSLEGIARRRTADIWLQKKGKRHFVGAIERSILEPICYIVGKISTWKK